MAFTYSLSTDTGKVRLKIADTGGVVPGGTATSGYAFDDAEISYALTEGGSVDAACGILAKALLADSARRMRAFNLPGMSYDDRARVAALKMLVDMYASSVPLVSVRMPAPIASDTGYRDPTPTFETSTGS